MLVTRATAQKNSGPPADAGATNFVRSTQAHSGLQCPELAQLRPQIVPWSTLCCADYPVLTTRLAATPLRPSFSGSCARPCGSERASGSIIDWPNLASDSPGLALRQGDASAEGETQGYPVAATAALTTSKTAKNWNAAAANTNACQIAF